MFPPRGIAKASELAYAYFEDELGQRSSAKLLTKDEVRRIAANTAEAAGAIAEAVVA